MITPSPTSPLQLQRIDHVVLRVRDLERSIAFYCAVLGCSVAKRRDDLGLVHLRAGDSMIDLVALDGPTGQKGGAGPADEGRNMDHLCLSYSNFSEAEVMAFLDSHRVQHGAKAQINFGARGDGTSIYLADPDENVVELKCYDAS